MKRLLSLAAAAGMLMSAMSVAPVAVMAKDAPNCAVFPLLKAECRAMMRDAAGDAAAATVAATAVVVTAGTVTVRSFNTMNGWHCERTPGGAALYSCWKD